MRKLIISLSIILSSLSTMAFHDPMAVDMTEKLSQALYTQEDPTARLALLKQYKAFLYQRLNTIELPDLDTTPEEDPRFEDYRSLTEYDGYINLINMPSISAKNCSFVDLQIRNSSRGTQDTVRATIPEVNEALKVLQALCH